MVWLEIILTAKIVVTGIAVALPFLLLPPARLATLSGTPVEAAPLGRLYGIAITALLVGYASGYWTIAQGLFPWGVVIMGIVSNGGGATALVVSGGWRRNLPITVFLYAVAAALIVAAAAPEWALSKAF